jgi:hypothetical protein
MNNLVEFIKGKKTYFAAAIAALYLAGVYLEFWAFDEKVLAAIGITALATLRAAIPKDKVPLLLSLAVLSLAAVILTGCATWSPPPGSTITVTASNGSDVTGTILIPVGTNVSIGATVTGNTNSGDVTGGLIIVFKANPSAECAQHMASDGARMLNVRTWLFPRDPAPATLARAIREGGALVRQGAPVTLKLKRLPG